MLDLSQINYLYKRINKSPDDQRTLFALESSKAPINFTNLKTELNDTNLNIMTFNMYYGRLLNIKNNNLDIGIHVNEYEIIFKNNLDVICLQEVVFGKLPSSRLKEGNTTTNYIERAKNANNKSKGKSGSSLEYWKKWTSTFKESDFELSWSILTNIANKHGYKSYPEEGGDASPCSMYMQKFGNVIFYNPKNLLNKGYTINFSKCRHINKTIKNLKSFNESEERSAIILCLNNIHNTIPHNKNKFINKNTFSKHISKNLKTNFTHKTNYTPNEHNIKTPSNNDLFIVTTHLSEKNNSNKLNIQVQTQTINTILNELNKLKADNVILCGDFNKPDNKTSIVLNKLLSDNEYNSQLQKNKHIKILNTLMFYDKKGHQLYDLLRKNKFKIMNNTFTTCWNGRTVDQFCIKKINNNLNSIIPIYPYNNKYVLSDHLALVYTHKINS